MSVKIIAVRLAELCRKGEFETAQKELYAEDALSTEAYATPAFEKETKGLSAIIEKGKKFEAMVEKWHSLNVSEPLLAGSSFAFTIIMDVTMKGQERMNMTELCVYKVKDGKIIEESFYM